jgi:hypothetical protein
MGFIEDFKKGRDAAYEKRGRAERLAAKRARRERSPAADDPPADDTTKLLTEVTELSEQLQKRVAELETELQQHASELDEKKQLLAELAAQCEGLEARAEQRDQFAEVLQAPGMRNALRKLFQPDAHPDANDEERRVWTEWSAKINAAYDLIDRDKKSREPDGREP